MHKRNSKEKKTRRGHNFITLKRSCSCVMCILSCQHLMRYQLFHETKQINFYKNCIRKVSAIDVFPSNAFEFQNNFQLIT